MFPDGHFPPVTAVSSVPPGRALFRINLF
jgi:hypothetical protein